MAKIKNIKINQHWNFTLTILIYLIHPKSICLLLFIESQLNNDFQIIFALRYEVQFTRFQLSYDFRPKTKVIVWWLMTINRVYACFLLMVIYQFCLMCFNLILIMKSDCIVNNIHYGWFGCIYIIFCPYVHSTRKCQNWW